MKLLASIFLLFLESPAFCAGDRVQDSKSTMHAAF